MAATKKVFEKVCCADCVFWDANKKYRKPIDGLCRLNQPMFVAGWNGATWPSTMAADWCGKGQSR